MHKQKPRMITKLSLSCLVALAGYYYLPYVSFKSLGSDYLRNSRKMTVVVKKNTEFDLANRQSLGLFTSVVESVWRDLQEKSQEDRIFPCPGTLLFSSENDVVCNPDGLYSQMKNREESGGNGCLAYYILQDYPIDNAEQETFQRKMLFDVADEACEVHIFNPFPHAILPEKLLSQVHYHDWSIHGSLSMNGQDSRHHKSFEEALKILGHEDYTIDILKADCNGSNECASLVADIFNSNVSVMQLLLKIIQDKDKIDQSFSIVMYENNYVPFHWNNVETQESNHLDISFLRLSADFFSDGNESYNDSTERDIKHTIPHNIFFTFKHNILETKEPKLFHDNILKTIDAYTTLWNDPKTRVIFLDDEMCASVVEQAYPSLLEHFMNEKAGIKMADTCRVAALYLYGGYYFDVDIEVINPLMLSDDVSFATAVTNQVSYFQAFMASIPKSTLLEKNLQYIQEYYEIGKDVPLLGPHTLSAAFDATSNEERGQSVMLQEMKLQNRLRYPELQRRGNEHGCCCNFIVHDPHTQTPYFWSRILGYSKRCHLGSWDDGSSAVYQIQEE